MNLYLLTRAPEGDDFSLLARELSDERNYKEYSRHEARSMRDLVEALRPHLKDSAGNGRSWIHYLDGFYYSYTIAHISKEFDLLKISGDGECILNIELKSESIEEDRVARQLAQNRYYLSHISNSIFSYTYVMETDSLYSYNDKGYLRKCEMSDLAEVLGRPAFSSYVEKDLDLYFRAADYLISPAAMPEKFLQGNYFLTNQQAEFRRRILEELRDEDPAEYGPVITVTGSAGTGKTLLLFDLAMALSRKKNVIFVHGGKLQSGHRIINSRLKNVAVCAADTFDGTQECSYLLIDEANRISQDVMDNVIRYLRSEKVPCVMAYDPHHLIEQEGTMVKAEERIEDLSTLSLEFTGNIRINRPVYSFLRALFHQKDRPANADYSCIDVLFAPTREDAAAILYYYREKEYYKITLPGGGGVIGEGLSADEIVGLEFDCVTVILDSRFYYDEDRHLRARGEFTEEALTLLYEGISRTREKLCLLVLENKELFAQILSIREG